MFKQVIVLEVFSDTLLYTENNIADLLSYYGVKNVSPKTMNNLPPNTIIATDAIVGNNLLDRNSKIYFPLLSHLQLPVKPGEWVWALSVSNNVEDNSFWISRVVGSNISNDSNYTHNDKKYINSKSNILINGKDTIEDGDEVKKNINKTLIINSPKASSTNNEFLSELNEYEFIINNAISSEFIQKEAIPKISSRPDEHLIEGSNNSYILLGTDRTENKPDVEITDIKNIKSLFKVGTIKQTRYSLTNSSEIPDLSNDKIIRFKKKQNIENIGCIDLVAGKKHNKFFSKKDLLSENTKNPLWKERDKSLDFYKDINKIDLFNEIDQPNFSDDSCRIYISQKTNVSKNFGLTWSPNQNIDESFSAIVNKSDHVKSIGRKDAGIIFQPKLDSKKEECSYAIFNNNVQIKSVKGNVVKIENEVSSLEINNSNIELKAQGKISLGNGNDELLKNIYSIVKVLIDNAQSISLSPVGPTTLNPIILTELNKILNSLIKITKL
jgi:hypothetical protein